MKIAVAGIGYVGLSNAILLAQNHEVVAVDIVFEKIDMLNRGISPIIDDEIKDFLETKQLNLLTRPSSIKPISPTIKQATISISTCSRKSMLTPNPPIH